MPNMDEFNRITVVVLGKLYEAFPQALQLELEDVHDSPNENDVRNFSYTVEFLASENYIKFQAASDEGLFFVEVTLTTQTPNKNTHIKKESPVCQ